MTGKGSNGLASHEMLAVREKCPEAPTKRKFHSLMEAEKAAAFSSQQYHKTVVPYACSGCGLWHVTGKIRGSDVARSNPSGIIKTAAMQQRENLATISPRSVERKDMSEVLASEMPIVPGNREARTKLAGQFLEGKTVITVPEVREALGGISRDTASDALRALGWSGKRGRTEWYPPGADPAPAPVKTLQPRKKALTHTQQLRKVKAHLKTVERITSPEVSELTGCSRQVANRILREAGWELIGHAKGAHWVPGGKKQKETPVAEPINMDAHRHPAATPVTDAHLANTGWRTVETNETISIQTVAQMNDTLRPFGFEVRIQLRQIG